MPISASPPDVIDDSDYDITNVSALGKAAVSLALGTAFVLLSVSGGVSVTNWLRDMVGMESGGSVSVEVH